MGTHPSLEVLGESHQGRLSKRSARRKFAAPAAVPERSAELSDELIARRAYEIYEARGDSGGDALSDWLTAERELRERAEASACTPHQPDRDIYH